MNPEFRIVPHRSAGNLHISLFGEFNGMCAWELFKTIRRDYTGSGRVFINTGGLDRITPEGVSLFKNQVTRKPLPPDWLYFKGEAGFQIAPDGSRVLICPKRNHPKRNTVQHGGHITRTVRFPIRFPINTPQTIDQPRRNK